MKTVGIIAEYNPFHKGHEYHIKEAKKLTGADHCVVVMSGDYVQRGEPAIIDKYSRAQMAILAGADLVLELPVIYSTASAEYFSSAAIAILDKLGMVDCLVFGSESGKIEDLQRIADILIEEPEDYKEILLLHMRNGRTYPFARNMALSAHLKDMPELLNLLSSPNNILGIEYLKALKKRNSSIEPLTICRQGAGYNSQSHLHTSSDFDFASALSIRSSIQETGNLDFVLNMVPDYCRDILTNANDAHRFPIYRNDFSALLKYKLLLNYKNGYKEFADVSEELSDRIKQLLNEYTDYNSFCDLLKTKNITYARVSRALMHILLDIRQDTYDALVQNDYLSYASLLGLRESSSSLLKAVKEHGQLNILTKPADAKKVISPFALDMFEHNILCSHIYQSVLQSKFSTDAENMYQKSPIIL